MSTRGAERSIDICKPNTRTHSRRAFRARAQQKNKNLTRNEEMKTKLQRQTTDNFIFSSSENDFDVLCLSQ